MPGKIRAIVKRKATGAGAISESFAPPSAGISPVGIDTAWELLTVTLHFSGDPGVENLVITYNSANDSAYDTVLKTQAMSGITSFWWGPAEIRFFASPGDTIDFAETNGNAETWGLEVTWGEVVA